MQAMQGADANDEDPFQLVNKIYEAYSPENTHMMREYMLHVMLKNVERMRKHKLITEAVYRKFWLEQFDLSEMMGGQNDNQS